MDRIQEVIFRNLVKNDEYGRKIAPFLKDEYFEHTDKLIFNVLNNFIVEFKKMPTLEVLEVGIEKLDLNEQQYESIHETLENIKRNNSESDIEWLVKETESFCQDKALFNAIQHSVEIYDGSSKFEKGSIPKIIEDALTVSFETDIGMSFLGDAEKRYELYHAPEEKIPFTLDILNTITRNGVKKKTLNLIMGDTNIGKSLILWFLAGMYVKMGYNVLGITLEMSELSVYERVDAHTLDVTIEDLYKLNKDSFLKNVKDVQSKNCGELVVKEFPTAGAHVGHFRHLINELKTKKKFKPDIIIVDYLNICQSYRYRSTAVNSYSFVKSIAEEIRGLAVEFDVPVWSATQSGRTGNNSANLQLNDISESYGTAQTVDLLLAVMLLPEHDDMYLFSQLKSRYTKKKIFPRFVLGVDYDKMKLWEPENDTQNMLYENRKVDEKESSDKSSRKRLDTSEWEM